jgi:uncharacterized damage-inducible protein DinB
MRSTILVLLAAASPALAQSAKQVATPKPQSSHSAVADVRGQWKQMSGYVLQSAIDVPEEKYMYKPTPEVRSFGELFAHVAGAQSMFCALALGEKAPAEDAVKVKTKQGVVDALKKSNADCDRAYAQSDAAVGAQVDVFGEQHSRLYALIMNATHDGEHYGNLVTYMRMNGMVPPSSK